MLELWRSTRGEDASFEVLRDALEQTGRSDLCDLVECKSPVALSPRRIHDNSAVSRDTKPDEAISLNSVLTSEKRADAPEGFRFDFPTNDNRKNEASAMDVGPVICEQGLRIDTQGNLGQNGNEEQITEQFMERDKSEIDFQELMGNDEQFYDAYEPTVAEDSTTRGERAANVPINVKKDSSCEGVVELEEKPQLIMQKKDICNEDTFEEAIVNDVQCKIVINEFDFMEENAEGQQGLNEENVAKLGPPEQKDENSNVDAFADGRADAPLMNGDAHDGTSQPENEDVIKRMFAGEQSVLDFFDTPQKIVDDNADEIGGGVTFV